MTTRAWPASLIFALAACAAPPGPDARAWEEGLVPVPELPAAFSDPQPAAAATDPRPQEAAASASSPARSNRIWVYLGQRSLDEDDWAPLEDQPMFGVEFSSERPGSILGWEVGLMGSYTSDDVFGVSLDATTGEIYGGVRKTFLQSTVRPYVGAGLSAINARLEGGGVSDDDTSLGIYGHGGAIVMLGQSFHLGLDLRGLFGTDVELFGVSGDADYVQLALVLGWLF